ncbi:DUF1796 family putative cysteine peptidase [Paraburkholderia bryophila]|uniref:Putative papain-like cysteine peptidase DUF1796 n=1 Tax=Paraburkholderia bryophila TaxID=420952 RepID=A0A329BNC1_9BURK|nr:DUF1796 family putative cysteine peptidase [Paraburkholderia bryophila]RAS23412.1 putative papain-like cysteine peptidase DUF1796 [Paraburkholderia bryophila]
MEVSAEHVADAQVTPDLVVDRVVSLGSNCELTANLRRYFKADRTYPFDWWITPLDSITQLLETEFDGLFNPENLQVSTDGQTVICRKFNLLHHHDFSRDEQGKVIPALAEQLPGLREKFLSLKNRFMSDCATGRVLFVRNRSVFDSNLVAQEPDSDESFRSLFKLLCKLFPQADITLLVTNVGKKGALDDGRILFDEMTNYGDADDYTVSPKGWDELFARQRIRIFEPASLG